MNRAFGTAERTVSSKQLVKSKEREELGPHPSSLEQRVSMSFSAGAVEFKDLTSRF
jgi:hypothetical protein